MSESSLTELSEEKEEEEEEEEEEEKEEFDVERLLEAVVKYDDEANCKTFYYLVKWVGYEESDSTWEPERNIDAEECIRTFWIEIGDSKPVVSSCKIGNTWKLDERKKRAQSISSDPESRYNDSPAKPPKARFTTPLFETEDEDEEKENEVAEDSDSDVVIVEKNRPTMRTRSSSLNVLTETKATKERLRPRRS